MIALLPKEDQPRATEINDMLKAEITKVGGDTKSVEQVCEYVSSICETLCKRNEFDNESWLGAIPSATPPGLGLGVASSASPSCTPLLAAPGAASAYP